MSSSLIKRGAKTSDQMVTVTTDALKDRLNRLYASKGGKTAQLDSFDSLWDMKELALLERKPSLEVPQSWLDELEGALSTTKH